MMVLKQKNCLLNHIYLEFIHLNSIEHWLNDTILDLLNFGEQLYPWVQKFRPDKVILLLAKSHRKKKKALGFILFISLFRKRQTF